MASIAGTDVEILVHTTAPSRGRDDTRYRALARAYIRFQPETHQRLEEESASNEVDVLGGQAPSQLQGDLLQSTQEERESAASYRPDEDEDASTGRRTSLQSEILDLSSHAHSLQSPMLSFNSVQDNIDSPVFQGLVTRDEPVSGLGQIQRTQDSSDSWRHSRSSIADSQPENNISVPEFISPSRILKLYLPTHGSAEEPSRQLGGRQHSDPETSTGSISTSQVPLSDSLESSRVLSSPSPNKWTRKIADQGPENRSHDTPSIQDPDLGLKRKWPESSSGEIRTTSAPPRTMDDSTIPSDKHPISLLTSPRKRQRIDVSSSENIGITTSLPSSQIIRAVRSSPPSTDRPSPWANLLEVRPAPPPTSTEDLTPVMFITDTLHQLASKMPAARLFRPVVVTRELRPMERGHWLLDCDSWDEDLRRRCWNFLGDRIGKNLVGWGVWCVRDAEYSAIRVYCWGIIVDYIYLLLYLASEGKIKKIGASWIGGDGNVIIKMPS
ncbi:hypothetical protein BGZ57DRAFT_486094 [Hyaloscypha finlandica]|nr:hypothetical protein BGZ57DRAFT_486094 [Hyaloscypha finlandica]